MSINLAVNDMLLLLKELFSGTAAAEESLFFLNDITLVWVGCY